MAYNPKTGKGMGNFYDANHRAFTHREWKGFKDTAYDFGRWLKLYGFMAAKLGVHPILMIKALMRYRWMVSFITASNMVDRHTIGLRGKELRYTHEAFFSLVHNSVVNIAKLIEKDEHLRPNNKKAAKLRKNTVMFDEMTPSFIMAGFPTVEWFDIAMFVIGMPGEVDQNANMYYIDAIEHFGLASDVCPLPAAEAGAAVVDDYPIVGNTYITSSMPCDGSIGQTTFMGRYFKDIPVFQVTPPQRFNEPEVNEYAVKNLEKCISFIEENYNVKWDWDAFWEGCKVYNEEAQCAINKWDVNCTDYPQVCGGALSLPREYEFQSAGCMDPYMYKTDLKIDKMMKKGYEEDKKNDANKPKYRAIVWACPAHYYTNFTYWAQHCWGVKCLIDMECMLSYHMFHIGDEKQAMVDMAKSYERMMMRSHTNGGYANSLDECWKMCEKFNTNIVIMYDHVSCKNVGGLHGLYEDQARERGIHLIWVPHDLMDPRTVSRKAMRDAMNNYMINVFREKPLDPTLIDYDDNLTW
ncbi:MAG: 2-hydroxyacyl-CoA dehydratase [Peptostreptococcaceae bacterium]|nr:2-hydroxyacyl-CoA dehydratase [Peptostreptococcaceae bacterium]